MKSLLVATICCSLSLGSAAQAKEEHAARDYVAIQGQTPLEPAQPTSSVPSQTPPAPPQQPPAPPTQGPRLEAPVAEGLPAPEAAANGQWVFTSQYGWVFMPYGDQYVAQGIGTDGNPYSYIYHPGYGWQWLASPWLLGLGPNPYFGALGPAYFGWYRSLQAARHDWGGRRGAWSYLGGG